MKELKRVEAVGEIENRLYGGIPIGWFDCSGNGLHASVVFLYKVGKRLEGIFFLETRGGKYIQSGDVAINWQYTTQGWNAYEYTHGGSIYRRRCGWLEEVQKALEESAIKEA